MVSGTDESDQGPKWPSELFSWWSTARKDTRRLLLNSAFLAGVLAPYPTILVDCIWDSLRVLRSLAILGVGFRFWYNWSDYTPLALKASVIAALLCFVLVELRAIMRSLSKVEGTGESRRWMAVQVGAEVVCISALHCLSRHPQSDLYLLFILPLVTAIVYLPSRQVLWVLVSVLVAIAVSTFGARAIAVADRRPIGAIFTNVLTIRSVFLLAGTGLLTIIYRYLHAQNAVWAAVMEAMPEGLAIISKADRRIKWANGVMQGFFGEDRQLIDQVCHHAYKRRESPCSPCPSEAAFDGRTQECITTSPEYVWRRPDGSEEIPPEVEWRRFDTHCAPIRHADEVIGALECVKDGTAREVLREATLGLQAAEGIDSALTTLGEAICALGYKRYRIYLTSPDKRSFVGRRTRGLAPEGFVGWSLPIHGEPYSETTCASNLPRVYAAPRFDKYREKLEKDPSLPWIEVPLRVGTELYGKVSIDNKGHPIRKRACLEAEAVGDTCDNMRVLHNIGVQVALCIGRLQAQQQAVTLLTSYVHSSLGLFTLVPTYAHELTHNGDPVSRRQAEEGIYAVTRVLSAYGKTVWKWGEMLCRLRPAVNLEAGFVDVNEVMREVSGWFGSVVSSLGCGIKVANEPLRAAVDRLFVEQIAFVLLSNAVRAALKKHGPRGNAQVNVVNSRTGPDSIEIRISDNGDGVPPQQAKTLFDNVVRVSHGRGMGMGLFVASNLARIHGGTVKLDANERGVGSVFTVELRELHGKESQ